MIRRANRLSWLTRRFSGRYVRFRRPHAVPVPARLESRRFRRALTRWLDRLDQHVEYVTKVAIVVALVLLFLDLFASAARGWLPLL